MTTNQKKHDIRPIADVLLAYACGNHARVIDRAVSRYERGALCDALRHNAIIALQRIRDGAIAGIAIAREVRAAARVDRADRMACDHAIYEHQRTVERCESLIVAFRDSPIRGLNDGRSSTSPNSRVAPIAGCIQNIGRSRRRA